jgi:hypothetical protein
MSLVASPHTDSWLSSFFARSASAEQLQPLLSSPREATETEEFMDEKREIEEIAMKVFVDVFTHRFLPSPLRGPRAAVLKRRNAGDAMILDQIEIDSANRKIVRILRSISGELIDRNIASRLIDHAIWALMTMVSMTSSGNTAYIRSCKDNAATYVMKALLFPLKRGSVSGDSLLYKTVRESNFKFGPEILAAIASRNDQRFRKSELEDKAVIGLFKKRYDPKVFDAFVAK